MIAGGAFAPGLLSAHILQPDKQDSLFNEQKAEVAPPEIIEEIPAPVNIVPRGLKEGSKIAITAPASGTSLGEVSRGAKFFKSMGCEVEIGDTIQNRTFEYQYLSNSDEKRAEELNSFISRDDIDCILCARGGYGVMRIMPFIDYDIIKQKPKIFLGFSDITALLIGIYIKTGLITYHGPVASSFYNDFTQQNIKSILFSGGNEFPEIDISQAEVYTGGSATGKFSGGNLSLVVSTLGTPYEIDTKDSVFFLEETFTEPYKIDRMLTQLWAAGKFGDCNAVALGYFEGLDARRSFYPGRSFTIRQVLERRFRDFGKPVVRDLPFGHKKDNLTIPLGIQARLNTDEMKLMILEKTVQ